MNGEKNDQENLQWKGRTAADAAAKEARVMAAWARETAEWATAEYSKRDGQFRRLAEMEYRGALARCCLEAKDAAKFWDAAADKWEAGERGLATDFEKEANAAMLNVMDTLDKSDDLRKIEQERNSGAQP